jgi:hypothetical protein
MKLLTTLAGGVLAAGAAQALPTPDHIYEFTGSYRDARGGPNATGNGGTFVGADETAGLKFGANQGPTLTNVFGNPATYSLELFFEFDFTSSYRKVIDFKNRSTHNGLYVSGGRFEMYGAAKSGGTIAPNAFTHLVLTRDGVSKQTTAYVNGVQAFSFIDSGNVATFSAANGIAHLLRDDGLGGGGENSPGTVDFIRTYNQVLGASDIAALYNNGNPVRIAGVPEPASWAMMIVGFGLAGAAARRRSPARVLA